MTSNAQRNVNNPPPWRWLGWAGFELRLPEFLRLSQVEGDAHRGELMWADQLQPRLLFRWNHDRRPPAHPLDRLRDQAQRLLKKNESSKSDPLSPSSSQLTSGSLDHLGPIVTLQLGKIAATHILGFAEASQRWFELFIPDLRQPGTPLDAQSLLDHFTDTAPDQPQRWSYFGNRCITPAGFHLVDCTLNLGDMTLVLRHQQRRFVELHVRHLYPAKFALSHQAPPRWIDAMHKQVHGTIRSLRRVRDDHPASFTSERGPVWTRDLFLLRVLGPRRLRTWLLHDEAADRLLITQLADKPEHFDATWQTVLEGLDWTASESDQ